MIKRLDGRCSRLTVRGRGRSGGARLRGWPTAAASAIALCAAGGLHAATALAAAPVKGPAGTWAVVATYPGPQDVADTYTFARRGTSSVYDVANAFGFTAVASIPDSGGAVTLDFSVPGSAASDHFIEPIVFKFPKTGDATFTGTFKQVYADGGTGYTGTLKGTRTSGPPATHHLTVTFSPARVNASGAGMTTATITDLDENDKPVADATVHIEPPLVYGQSNPEALVCDDSGRLVSPVRLSTGSLDGLSFDRTTDSAGQIHLTLYVGARPGEWSLDAFEKSKPGSERAFGVLNVGPAGGSAALPFELSALLAAAADSSLADFGVGAQRAALTWLGTVAGPGGALPGVAFAPIHSVDAVGTTQAGVVLYADSPAVRQEVLTYLAGDGPAPSDQQAVVIDAKLMSQLLIGTRIAGQKVNALPYRLPSLGEWADGGFVTIQDPTLQSRNKATKVPVPAHGAPRLGLVGASGNDDLLYGYGPYPPAGAQAQTEFSRCTGHPFDTTIVPHSPVRLEALGPRGTAAGIDVHGHAIDTLPGAIVNYRGSKLVSLQLPPGTDRLSITGTGAGIATLVITTPARAGASTRVFSFRVRRAQKGTLALTRNGAAATLRWGRRTIRASNGLRISVHGLRSRLKRGRLTQLKLKITDQFGKPAVGVSLAAHGTPIRIPVAARSNSSGVISVPINPTRRGTIRARFSGIGYATVSRSLKVS